MLVKLLVAGALGAGLLYVVNMALNPTTCTACSTATTTPTPTHGRLPAHETVPEQHAQQSRAEEAGEQASQESRPVEEPADRRC